MAALLGRVGLAGLLPALPAARAAFQPLWCAWLCMKPPP
jgi:hypothetical protein